jgi:hypothetical protein
MMQIPSIPFRITIRHVVAGVMREDHRSAVNLAEAWDKYERELAKPGKRTVRLDVTLAEAQRGGGA